MSSLPPEDQPESAPPSARYVLDAETDKVIARMGEPVDPSELDGKEGVIGAITIATRIPGEPEADHYVGEDGELHPAKIVADPFAE